MTEVWGLTGGVASGKTAVARLFAERGIPVIDADQITRELSREKGVAHPLILKRFGTVDRLELREIVFNDIEARKDLEAILHPLIQAESLRQIQASRSAHLVYEAALLVETGRYRDFSGLIVVDASRSTRKKRLIARDGVTTEMAEKMLNSQTADARRLEAATVVIENSGTLEELRQKIDAFLRDHKW